MGTWWTVVADRTVARIFESSGRFAKLSPITALTNPDGRLKSQELVSDGPGRISAEKAPGNRSTYGDRETPREQVMLHFSKEVAQLLKQGLNDHKYEKLRLVAEPQTLGRIRNALDKEVVEAIEESLAKDLAQLPDTTVEARLMAALE